MRQESSRWKHDTPFHSEEQAPLDLHMDDLEKHHEDKEIEETIKEKEASVRELKDDISKENFMVSFLQQ